MVIKKKKQQKNLINNLKGGFFITFAAVLMVGIAALNHQSKNERIHTGQDFCRTDFIPEVTAILVDHTDSFTPLQQAALRRSLQETALAVKKNGMVQLYSVDNIRTSILHPEFSLCNPGDEEDLKNKLSRRASTVRKNYEDIFIKNLEAELDKALADETAQESPIIESIQSVLVTSFAGKDKETSKKTLIIVSDLLEHTSSLSFFKGVPDFNEYKKTLHWQNSRSDMQGVNVKVLLVRRERGQSSALLLFWERFFESQGANFLGFENI